MVELRSVLECKAAAKVRVEELCEKHGILIPEVTFTVRGTDAGQAFVDFNRIDLNMALFRENFDHVLGQVVPHELAHLWVIQLKLGGKPHGREWQSLMRRMGVPPIPCHNMNVDAVVTYKSTGFFSYRCLCNTGNMVSLEMHRRIQSEPEVYRCDRCDQQFVYIG